MKNIFILPTDQPSRLRFFCGRLELMRLVPKKSDIIFQHIYITSDEEIKDGDWMIRGNEQPTLVTPNFFWDFGVRYYKIILTTDPTLIADGVQAIDDEFLEWFVKNPTCDFVEVDRDEREVGNHLGGIATEYGYYKIIIPEEEPKKETLEEAAEKYANKELNNEVTSKVGNFYGFSSSFMEGAKWQSEKLYNEEDVRELLMKALTHNDHNLCGSLVTVEGEIRTANFGVWFEENKKK
jgi:hypothetical protein